MTEREIWLATLKLKYPNANVVNNGTHISAMFNCDYVGMFSIVGNYGWVV